MQEQKRGHQNLTMGEEHEQIFPKEKNFNMGITTGRSEGTRKQEQDLARKQEQDLARKKNETFQGKRRNKETGKNEQG